MNYIELIKWFWQLDKTWQFSCCETWLYFYLVETANCLGWEDKFWHRDATVVGNVGVSNNTMKTARNKLVQSGLINVENGGKGYGDKTRYQILIPNSIPKPYPKVQPKPYPKVQPLIKPNQTKPNNSFSPQAVNPKNEKKNSRDYWEKIINAWFDFYGKNFKTEENLPAKPLFKKVQAAQLGNIYDALKKVCTDAGKEWTEDYAIYCHKGFFQLAHNDLWLSKHFELGNMVSQFNSIVNKKKENNGSSQNIKSVTGINGKSVGAIALANELAAEIGLT